MAYAAGGAGAATPYGAVNSLQLGSNAKPPFLRTQRRRLNILGILVSLFGPWLVFIACCFLLAFAVHATHEGIVRFLLVLIFLGILVQARFAFVARMAVRATDEPVREPSWMIFQTLSLLLAFFAGVVVGQWIFTQFTLPHHQVTSLNDYHGVDPVRMRGQQLLDAGSVVFTPESRIDVSKAMSFRNLDMYCVAPIAGNTSGGVATYDFWAVGRNCCANNGAGFRCARHKTSFTHSAIRLVRSQDREYYRLAVQQAEATYNIRATHPLFFVWDEDPTATLEGWKAASLKNFVVALSAYFLFQAFVVAAATVAFTKLGRY